MDQGFRARGQVSMNILVTGARGFIGSALVSRLANGGHRVVPLRRATGGSEAGPTWNPPAGQVRLEPAGPLSAVVHLAGENIAQRWTPTAKARIRASRVDATRLLCEAPCLFMRSSKAHHTKNHVPKWEHYSRLDELHLLHAVTENQISTG